VIAERQDRPAAEHRMRVVCRPTVGIKADTLRQHFSTLRGEQDIALRHDARRLVPNQRQPAGAGAAECHRAGAEQLAIAAHTTIRRRPFTMASAIKPSAANGSMSGQTAAKWCELRIATAAIPCRRAFPRSSGALARRADCAKPFAASVATSPGAASVTTGAARPSTQPLFSVET